MNLKDFFPFGKPKQLLVCETDGFSLRGAVLARSGDAISVLHHARIEHVDMGEAVEELIKTLHQNGWEVGGQAVLLSPAVLSTLVELPVSPKKPRPIAQMQELIRWEVEPQLLQHAAQLFIGRLMVERGYMTEEQATVVMDMQQGRPNPDAPVGTTESFSMRRFGELAEELGYIRHSQLNACLLSQEWLKVDDEHENVECGWQPQAPVADVPGMFNWLVSCVNKTLLQRWYELFASHGITLQGVFPLTGCSAALLPEGAHAQVIMESHPGPNFIGRVVDGRFTEIHEYRHAEKTRLERCLESFHALNVSTSESLWFAGWQPEDMTLIDEMTALLDIKVTPFADFKLVESVTPGMLGAARAALGLTGGRRCVQVRVGGPLPPVSQRLEVRAAVLAGMLLLAIIGTETWMWVEQNALLAEKADVDAQWKLVDEAVKRINAEIQKVEKRKTELDHKKQDQARLQALYEFYSRDIPERMALVRSILGVLRTAVNEEVIITNIDELGKRASLRPAPIVLSDERVEVENFNLEAWAISEESAQAFIQRMKQVLEPWDMEVRDPQVQNRIGPLNLDGFTVALRLVKLKNREEISGGAR